MQDDRRGPQCAVTLSVTSWPPLILGKGHGGLPFSKCGKIGFENRTAIRNGGLLLVKIGNVKEKMVKMTQHRTSNNTTRIKPLV